MLRRALPLLAALSVLAPAATPARAAPRCAPRGDEVRFDDGRLLVERSVRAVDPRTVRERWWACWRPTARRALLVDARHPAGVGDLSLLAVAHGRFAVLTGGGRLDVYDARRGRRTATLAVAGAVRELAITLAGHAAVLQDTGRASVLVGAGGARSCLLDTASAMGAGGAVFGGVSVRGEWVAWHRDGVLLGGDLRRLDCAAPA